MPEEERELEETSQGAKTILIVDDDEDIGMFLVEAIRQETLHHPIWVTDGFAALKLVHGLKPDLLLLDYQLPHMNGIELFDQLSAIKGVENIPAILMTAGTGMPWRQLEKRNIIGIAKPLELSPLLTTIEKLLTST